VSSEKYKLTGTKKKVESAEVVQCNTDLLYTKDMQHKDQLKKPAAYQGLTVPLAMYWRGLANLHYRNNSAMDKAKFKKAKAAAI
jgi:hypothetical protein